MRLLLLSSLLCWMLAGSAFAQDIVVNEYLNTDGSGEYVELLVLTDKLDLRGYQVRDFTTTSGNVGGTITFEDDALWECLRRGYLIIIDIGVGSSSDVNFADGVVTVGEDDASYFQSAGSFGIGGSKDGVEVLDASSAHVHMLYHGNPPGSSDFAAAAAMSPGAQTPSGTLATPGVARFYNTDAVADFDNDANVEKSTTITKGDPNDATQEAFKAQLLPIWINELQIDGGGTVDNAEFVEIVGPAGFSILNYTVFVTDCPVLGSATTATYTLSNAGSTTFADEVNKFGFYILGDPTSGVADNDQDLTQAVFNETGQSDEELPDALEALTTSGAVVLRDVSGNTVFEFGYGICSGYINRIGTGVSDESPDFSEGFLLAAKPTDADGATKLVSTAGSPNLDAGGEGQALPVELVAFEARADGEAVLLYWKTASETNNAGFEIQQRGTSSSKEKEPEWQVVSFVDGHGTTERTQSYTFRIDHLVPGMHRFRFKQIDYDGAFEYSPEVEVAIGVPGMYHLTAAYPNPFNPETLFSLSVARAQDVQVAVYDVVGRRVALLYDGAFPAETARAFRFEAGTLPSGIYLLRVVGESFMTTQPLVLTK